MEKETNVLIVEQEPMLLLLESECIAKTEGFRLYGIFPSISDLSQRLASPRHSHDIVILNPYPSFDIFSRTLDTLRKEYRGVEIIAVSRSVQSSFISTAYLHGVFDYILAPFSLPRLRTSLIDCRRYLQYLASLPTSLEQKHVDALLERRRAPTGHSFQIPSKTPEKQRLSEILSILAENETPLPLAEIARRSSLSRSSVWRCLRYLEEAGFIGSRQAYKGVGRPSVNFFPLESPETFRHIFFEKND